MHRNPDRPLSPHLTIWKWGPHMLVGNTEGVYASTADRRFTRIATVGDLVHLVMADEGLCYAIGRTEIALFAWDGERWIEPAPRIAGVRNPAVVHRAGRSAWIEMGGDGVARSERSNAKGKSTLIRSDELMK